MVGVCVYCLWNLDKFVLQLQSSFCLSGLFFGYCQRYNWVWVCVYRFEVRRVDIIFDEMVGYGYFYYYLKDILVFRFRVKGYFIRN